MPRHRTIIRATILLCLALLLSPAGAWAQTTAPILNAGLVPHLDAAGRAQYLRFIQINLPRALALSANGKLGWFGGGGTLAEARAKALKSCADKGATDCALYAENLEIVWPGRQWQPTPPPAAALISTGTHVFIPDQRYLWHGPQAAAGVYVWAHGKAAGNVEDSRGLQPHNHVRHLNARGFDVVRFDRDPDTDDAGRAEIWLRDGLAELRRRGWRKVIVGGQSRGGWNALQMVNNPGLADAIVSVSAGRHGPSSNASQQYDDLRRDIGGLAPQSTRAVIAQFNGDPFLASQQERRKTFYEERLRPKLGALLLIDRPEGMDGHFAAATSKFSDRYGDCIARFILGDDHPPGC